MNIYECGMGSHKARIEAPSAEVAAFYYFANCVVADVPLVAVYTENGQPYTGDKWWMAAALGVSTPDVEQRMKIVFEQIYQCRVISDNETEVTFDTLAGENRI